MLLGHNHKENGYYCLVAYRNGVVVTNKPVRVFVFGPSAYPVPLQAAARNRRGVAT